MCLDIPMSGPATLLNQNFDVVKHFFLNSRVFQLACQLSQTSCGTFRGSTPTALHSERVLEYRIEARRLQILLITGFRDTSYVKCFCNIKTKIPLITNGYLSNYLPTDTLPLGFNNGYSVVYNMAPTPAKIYQQSLIFS